MNKEEEIIKQVLEHRLLDINMLKYNIYILRGYINHYTFINKELNDKKKIYNKSELKYINNEIKKQVTLIQEQIKILDNKIYGSSVFTKAYNKVKETFMNLLCKVPVSTYKKSLDPISFKLNKKPSDNIGLLVKGAIVKEDDSNNYGTIISINPTKVKFNGKDDIVEFDYNKHRIVKSFNIDQMLTKLKIDVTDETSKFIDFKKGGLLLKKTKKKSNKKQKSIKNRTRTRYI